MASTDGIKVGAIVTALNGEQLGKVREVYPHFLLVSRDGEHADLEIPAQSILSADGNRVQTSVNHESATRVDDVETAHRLKHD